MIEITAISQSSMNELSFVMKPTNEIPATSFSAVIDKLESTNDSIIKSNHILESAALNEPVSAHDLMMTISKAKSELKLVVEVRNKLLEAYQEVMRMQV